MQQNVKNILLHDNFSMILTEKGNLVGFGKNNSSASIYYKYLGNFMIVNKFFEKAIFYYELAV